MDISRRVIALRSALLGGGSVPPRTLLTEDDGLAAVMRCFESFEDVVRYLNARRTTPTVCIDCEDAVQDVLYMILKPTVPDLEWENPMPKEASRSWRPDFNSNALSMAIDAKFIRDKAHGKRIVAELDEDIAAARELDSCRDVFFFVYDPSLFIPSVTGLTKHCDGLHDHEGCAVQAHTYVVPTVRQRRARTTG